MSLARRLTGRFYWQLSLDCKVLFRLQVYRTAKNITASLTALIFQLVHEDACVEVLVFLFLLLSLFVSLLL